MGRAGAAAAGAGAVRLRWAAAEEGAQPSRSAALSFVRLARLRCCRCVGPVTVFAPPLVAGRAARYTRLLCTMKPVTAVPSPASPGIRPTTRNTSYACQLEARVTAAAAPAS